MFTINSFINKIKGISCEERKPALSKEEVIEQLQYEINQWEKEAFELNWLICEHAQGRISGLTRAIALINKM